MANGQGSLGGGFIRQVRPASEQLSESVANIPEVDYSPLAKGLQKMVGDFVEKKKNQKFAGEIDNIMKTEKEAADKVKGKNTIAKRAEKTKILSGGPLSEAGKKQAIASLGKDAKVPVQRSFNQIASELKAKAGDVEGAATFLKMHQSTLDRELLATEQIRKTAGNEAAMLHYNSVDSVQRGERSAIESWSVSGTGEGDLITTADGTVIHRDEATGRTSAVMFKGKPVKKAVKAGEKPLSERVKEKEALSEAGAKGKAAGTPTKPEMTVTQARGKIAKARSEQARLRTFEGSSQDLRMIIAEIKDLSSQIDASGETTNKIKDAEVSPSVQTAIDAYESYIKDVEKRFLGKEPSLAAPKLRTTRTFTRDRGLQ